MKNSRMVLVLLAAVFYLFSSVGFCDDPPVLDAVIAEQAKRELDLRGQKLTIGTVKVAGNRSVSVDQVLAAARSRSGELFSPAAATEDSGRIAKLKGIQYSYYNTTVVDGKIELTFVVVERSIIRSINFRGNKKLKAVALKKKSDLQVGNYLDPIMAASGAKRIEEYYHEKGFAFAQVKIDENQLPAGRVLYGVYEGPRVRVKSVSYSGNKAIPTGKIKKGLKSKTRKFFLLPGYYSKEQVEKDTTKIHKAYQKKGYLNTNINLVEKFNKSRTEVELAFEISEGEIYKIDRIVFAGMKNFTEKELLEKLKLISGGLYSEERAQSDTKNVANYYRENGFINVGVDFSRKFVPGNKVDIKYKITEGDQFRIGQVNISGNELTQDKVIRRILDEYDFVPGKLYDAKKAQGDGKGDLEKILRQSVLAESATIISTGDMLDRRDAAVSIIEGKTGSIILGAGVASDSGLIGQFVVEQRNFDIFDTPGSFKEFITGKAFRGAGQTLRISLEPGTEVSQYSISFTEPYFYNRPISLDVAGSRYIRGFESHLEERSRGYVGLEKRYKNKWRRSIGFRAENIEVTDVDWDAPLEIKKDKGDNAIIGVSFGVSKNATNDRFLPTAGYIFNASVEPVSGDHSYATVSSRYVRYKTLYEDLAERKTVLSTRFQASAILGDALASEKFYAGGSSTIRGFDYRGVSTRGKQTTAAGVETNIKKDPIGSDWLLLANAEVTVPLLDDTFSWLVFVDSGVIDTGGPRASLGTGIQMMIPQWFGPVPMRFEFATPLLKQEGDETQVFSFTVGRLF